MTQPDSIGPLIDLLKERPKKFGFGAWHTFDIRPQTRGAEAGRWCNTNILGQWTFRAQFGQVTFYIKDSKDAMLFKLVWGGQ